MLKASRSLQRERICLFLKRRSGVDWITAITVDRAMTSGSGRLETLIASNGFQIRFPYRTRCGLPRRALLSPRPRSTVAFELMRIIIWRLHKFLSRRRRSRRRKRSSRKRSIVERRYSVCHSVRIISADRKTDSKRLSASSLSLNCHYNYYCCCCCFCTARHSLRRN